MALIENLVIALGLKDKGFKEGLDKNKKKLSDFQKSMQAMKGTLAKLGIAIGAIALSRMVVNNIREATNELDNLAKTADKLGIVPEQLSAMRYASQRLTTLSVQSFDTALQRMIKRISYAAQGQGEGLTAFKQLGIDVKNLKMLSPEKQLMTIANAFGKVASSADKVGLAARIFDSEGVGMINLLNAGSKGLSRMIERAEKLGIIFSRLELAGVESMKDMWGDIELTLKAVWQRLAVEIAPAMTMLGETVLDMVLWVKALGAEWINIGKILEYTIKVFGTGALVVKTFYDMVSEIGRGMGAFGVHLFKQDETSKQMMDYQVKQIERYRKELEGLFKGSYFEAFDIRLKKFRDGLKDLIRDAEGEELPGSDKQLRPAALMKGTREAAEAAAKAGVSDRNVEMFRTAVDKVAILINRADSIDRKFDAILGVVAADTGIA